LLRRRALNPDIEETSTSVYNFESIGQVLVNGGPHNGIRRVGKGVVYVLAVLQEAGDVCEKTLSRSSQGNMSLDWGVISVQTVAVFQQASNTSDETLDVVLPVLEQSIVVCAQAQIIPHSNQCMKEQTHWSRIVNLTIVGRYPASGTGREYGSICPAIRMREVYEKDIALSQRGGNGDATR